MKSTHVLGMNARNHLYLSRYNTRVGKAIADSKLKTKEFLRRRRLPHPRLIVAFRNPKDVPGFDWGSLSENFVVKPAGSYAGEGIMIVRRRLDSENFGLIDGSRVSLDDLKYHLLDILEGRFDKHDFPGLGLIEERVVKHRRFKRYAYRGTPDIRVIIFNKVPIMAMLRLPTRESRGRANLHQGAVGVGIDLATGITTRAVHWDRKITRVPDRPKLKLNGLKIPWWERILELSVAAQSRLGLGYLGVDFLLDPEKGPLIIELSARPGLSIQLTNMAGLKRRLERVEGLDIKAGKGIEVAKALFAEGFADKVLAEKGAKIVGVFETAKLRGGDGEKHEAAAKVDTGAYRSSIDRGLAAELGLLKSGSVLWHDYYVSALGREKRPIIPVTFWLKGRKVETTANVSNRSRLKQKILIGRRDLGSFMVKTTSE